MSYALSTTLHTTFEDAVAKTRKALADQGFGVLTEIDMKATLKAKLGEDMEDYLILGACNPPLAHPQSRPQQLARRRSHLQPAAQRRGWQRQELQRALRRVLPPVCRRPAQTPAQAHRRQAWRRWEPDRRPRRRSQRRA